MTINTLFAIYALAALAMALCLRSYAISSTSGNRRAYNDAPPLSWYLCVLGSGALIIAAVVFALLAMFWGP